MIDYDKLWDELEGKAWQIKEEFINFLKYIYPHVDSVLEIGTHKGGSALGFLKNGHSVISIDIEKKDEVVALEKNPAFSEKFTYYYRLDANRTQLPKVDLLFIDGEHYYESVKKDYEDFEKYVRPGGYIALHDVKESQLHVQQENGAVQFWKEIRGDKYVEFFDPQIWGGIGLVRRR